MLDDDLPFTGEKVVSKLLFVYFCLLFIIILVDGDPFILNTLGFICYNLF